MSQSKLNRRAFAKTAAMGTAASITMLSSKPAAAAQEVQVPTEADLLLEVIKQRYPAEFKEEELSEIRRDLLSHVGRSKTLRDFPLANADEPGFVFAAYRGE